MRILEANGPSVLAGTGEELYKRGKPRHAVRLIPRRAPVVPVCDAVSVSVNADAGAESVTGRRALPALRLAIAILGAAALLCAAALVGVASGFFSKAGEAITAVTRITVIDGDETRLVFTHAKTAGEVMDMLGISPDEDDYINVAADTPVTPDMTLEFHAVEFKEYVIDEVLPHATKTEELQTIPRGEVQVLREGMDGRHYREVRAEYRDGRLYKEYIFNEKYVAPTDELQRVGVGGTLAGADGKTYRYSYYIDVSATAYAAEGITYTGKQARNGIVAVDPDVIPLGTKLYVKGDYGDYGVCTADDIGSGINGNRIDICMEADISVLFEFGIRPMRVYILE